MKSGVAGSVSILILPVAAMVALSTFTSPVNGQTARPIARPASGTPPAGGSTSSDGPYQPPSVRQRQYIMLSMEIEAARGPLTPEKRNLALGQIAEDYARIQVINNKMMSAAMSAAIPHYASVADTVKEIGKRAGRIKVNLPLPGEDKKDASAETTEFKNITDPASLKASLLLLDARIMSFVDNPIFKNTSVVDVQDSARAKRDLDTIIEFSHRVAKDAKALSKTVGKRP